MTGLQGLLAGELDAGVYTWAPEPSSADVRRTVEQAGWRLVELDTAGAGTKPEFLAECKRSFGFPDWVGNNFDALADALSDVRAGEARGVLVVWRGWRRLAEVHPHAFSVALSVFAGRVAFGPGGRFAVLLQSSEPADLDLPALDPYVG